MIKLAAAIVKQLLNCDPAHEQFFLLVTTILSRPQLFFALGAETEASVTRRPARLLGTSEARNVRFTLEAVTKGAKVEGGLWVARVIRSPEPARLDITPVLATNDMACHVSAYAVPDLPPLPIAKRLA